MHRQGLPLDVMTSGAKRVQQLGYVHVLGSAHACCVHCKHAVRMCTHIACLAGMVKQ